MLGTYASALLVFAAAAATGQAVLSVCGREQWSWLAPAVGLAALMPIAWWSVRLPGEGTAGAIALAVVAAAALLHLRGRVDGAGGAVRTGLPVALIALATASLPFLVEGRFGIMGTGLNPDMSQHLLAADRLADSGSERLISSGYPLGPHALAVSLAAVGPSLVHAFGGLTLAAAVVTTLTPLGLLSRLAEWRRVVVALLVGLAYMTAAYFTQGAFKETLQALFVLAFAVGLADLARGRLAGSGLARAVPLAVIAAGSVYVYSFPGLAWLVGAASAWAAVELFVAWRERGREEIRRIARRAAAPAIAAGTVLIAATAPELGRMREFASFETFDPEGEGLGNLFDRISPLEALGIWPSGDFRVEPGAGFVPAAAFWLGAAIALAALAFGIWWWLRRGERAVPAAFVAAAALVAAASLGGTPYQEAKAIALAAPLAMLISARALAAAAPSYPRIVRIVRRRGPARLFPRSARTAGLALGVTGLAVSFTLAAGLSTILALANGPVGPTTWTPALLELKPLPGATLVLASESYLSDEHGRDFVVWELRGGEVCVEPDPGPSAGPPPPGIRQLLVAGDAGAAPFAGAVRAGTVGDFTLWAIPEPTAGDSGCPFVADGARADPSADG